MLAEFKRAFRRIFTHASNIIYILWRLTEQYFAIMAVWERIVVFFYFTFNLNWIQIVFLQNTVCSDFLC